MAHRYVRLTVAAAVVACFVGGIGLNAAAQQQQQRPAQAQPRPPQALPPASQAPQSPPAARGPLQDATIVILNVDGLLARAKAMEGVRQQVDRYGTKLQDDLNKEEEALRREEQEFLRQRSVLTTQAFADKERDFRNKVVQAQRRAQARRRAVDQVTIQARDEVLKSMGTIIDQLSRERGFNIVLATVQVVFARRELDITDDVLERLDRAIPQVKVAQPQEPKE